MIWSFSDIEATTGANMGDLEDLKIYVRKVVNGEYYVDFVKEKFC